MKIFSLKIESIKYKEVLSLQERLKKAEYDLLLEKKESFEYKKKYEEQHDRADKLWEENCEAWSAKFWAESQLAIQQMLLQALIPIVEKVNSMPGITHWEDGVF